MSRQRTEAFFLSRAEHALFCVLISPPPDVRLRGAVLHVPAFAEEMNKSRRAVANAARGLAAQGWHVLLLDLHGTGDSSGDFGDATWRGWIDDVHAAVRWLQERFGATPVLWGLRVGCLLLSDSLPYLPPSDLVFWQPVQAGELALTQFLRLRTVGRINRADAVKETVHSLVESLHGGASLEVAGYRLAPGLALPLREARLGGPQFHGRRVRWLEVSTAGGTDLSPAGSTGVAGLRAVGARVDATAVEGVSFWMTQEIDPARALVDVTLAQMSTAP